MQAMPSAFWGIARRVGAMLSSLWLVVWWGGLTFYAAAVVPIATKQIGGLTQGGITREVTVILNGLAVGVTVIAISQAVRRRDRTHVAISLTLGVITAGLIAWHHRLSAMMSADPPSVPDDFYQHHAVYLWLTTAQWLAGLLLLVRMGPGNRASPTQRSPGHHHTEEGGSTSDALPVTRQQCPTHGH